VDTFLLQILGKGFFDDVENGEGDWTHGGNGDLWHITEHQSYSPTHSWYSGNEGSWQYANNMNAWLMTPEIALYPESKLVFWTYYDLETNYDYGYVEISTDGGNTWQQLGEELNGASGGWVRLEYDLRSYSGAVLIRFRQTSDGVVTREGWYVDNISVEPWPYPDVEVSPLSFDVTLPPDTVDTLWMTISNVGQAPLHFTVRDTEWQVGEILLRKAVGGRTAIKWARPHYEPAKGEPDPGRGVSPVKGQGGPDGYGYIWIDSDEAGGPVYDWVEISGVGTPLNLGDDDYVEVSLPFPFNFYGEAKNSVKISSNGYLAFGINGVDYLNDPIPDPEVPNDLIAPFWDDLNPTQGGQVYYCYDEDNSRFIVEWKEVPHWYNEGSYTFEAILYPDGHIIYQYNTMDGDLTSATVGIENGDGSDGLEVVYNAAYIHDGLAVWLGVNLGWLTEDPASGVVEVGESMDIGLIFNTAELDTGEYGAIVEVICNDPQDSVVNVSISLHVSYFYPQIDLSPQSIDTSAYVGDVVIDTITVQNTGDATLDFTVETEFTFVSSNSGGVHANSVSKLVPRQDWLEVTPTSGSVPPSGQTYLQVALDATSLSEGTYTATIHINSNDPENPTVDVPVTFHVYQMYPHIIVIPTEIDTFGSEGQVVYDTIAIGNTGVADLVFAIETEFSRVLGAYIDAMRVEDRQDWLEISPDSGTVPPGGTTFVQVKLDATNLTPGNYSAYIYISSNDTANPYVVVPVAFHVYPSSVLFVRGDANADGNVDISDAVYFLRHISPAPDFSCMDAADFNDDGVLNVSDPIYLVDHLTPSPSLPAPNLECGPDPTEDSLDCISFLPCGGKVILLKKAKSVKDTLYISPSSSVILRHSDFMVAFQFDFWGKFEHFRAEGSAIRNFAAFKIGTNSEKATVLALKSFDPNSSDFALFAGASVLFDLVYEGELDSVSAFYVNNEGEKIYPIIVYGGRSTVEGDIDDNLTFRIFPGNPNPFRKFVDVSFSIPFRMEYGIDIYDVSGRLVKSERFGKGKPDVKTYRWYGVDNYGRRVKSGVYFIKLKAGKFEAISRVILAE